MTHWSVIRFFLCFILILPQTVSAQQWRKIIPLKSTRADVERLLGETKEPYAAIYELEDGNLFIEYSSGPCRPDRKGGWDVPENTVISFSFSPKAKQRASDLRIDRRKFKTVKDRHSDGFGYYLIDEADGVMYEVQLGHVDYVEYYPPRKYNALQCRVGPASTTKEEHR